jgi:hypothetical protein
MGGWKTDVSGFLDKPTLCKVRECEYCNCKQVESYFVKMIDPMLKEKCSGTDKGQ